MRDFHLYRYRVIIQLPWSKTTIFGNFWTSPCQVRIADPSRTHRGQLLFLQSFTKNYFSWHGQSIPCRYSFVLAILPSEQEYEVKFVKFCTNFEIFKKIHHRIFSSYVEGCLTIPDLRYKGVMIMGAFLGNCGAFQYLLLVSIHPRMSKKRI